MSNLKYFFMLQSIVGNSKIKNTSSGRQSRRHEPSKYLAKTQQIIEDYKHVRRDQASCETRLTNSKTQARFLFYSLV